MARAEAGAVAGERWRQKPTSPPAVTSSFPLQAVQRCKHFPEMLPIGVRVLEESREQRDHMINHKAVNLAYPAHIAFNVLP